MKNNKGQKWYQSIGLPSSCYRKRFQRFLFSRHLVFYKKLPCVINRMLGTFLIAYPYAKNIFSVNGSQKLSQIADGKGTYY